MTHTPYAADPNLDLVLEREVDVPPDLVWPGPRPSTSSSGSPHSRTKPPSARSTCAPAAPSAP
jgi:hypothetical protein